jgi:hypothetical protein
MIDSYLKNNNVTSPVNTSIYVENDEGILAAGFSSKHHANWNGAIWPYKSRSSPAENLNLSSAIIIIYGTLESEEFRKIVDSLSISRRFLPAGASIAADSWILTFAHPLNFSAKVEVSELEGGTNVTTIKLMDAADEMPAKFTIFDFPAGSIATDDLLNGMLDVYMKGANATSPEKSYRNIDGARGLLAEGYSAKYEREWFGAIWPYRPYYDSAKKINRTSSIILFEGTLNRSQVQHILQFIHLTRHYQVTAGPWIVEFNSSQSLKTRSELSKSGESWLVTLVDGIGHEVAWFSLMTSANLLSATDDSLDKILDSFIESYQLTAPTKKPAKIEGINGRMAEGYSSSEQRPWRMILYPYKPFFDTFTNVDMSKNRIGFWTIQDLPEFSEIVESLHVTNVAV